MDILEYKLAISHPTPFPAYDNFILHTLRIFNLSVAPIALMAISDEAESPGQPPLETTIKDTLGGLLFNYYVQFRT